MNHRLRTALAAIALRVLHGCTDTSPAPTDAATDGAADAGAGPDSGAADLTLTPDAASPDIALPDGALPDTAPAKLTIHIRANTALFAHTDGASGQTPLSARGGIRSLRLYRQSNDPNPVELFQHGKNPIEVGFNQGDDTVVATIDPKAIPAASYTLARMVQTHSRFRIAGTMHELAKASPGSFDDVLVVSNGTLLDGQLRDAGYYLYLFDAQGQPQKKFTGNNAPIAGYSTTAGATAKVEQGEWAIYFPINLTVAANGPAGSELAIDVNMYQSFRWTDSPLPGNQAGVFDASPLAYEAVVRFGGNRFDTTLK
ncbi:MAG: hypothetical protein EXR72_01800 [Myxococcales bacterium]|nr:hypothetical protein [Myxococcales bacterium]